MRIAIVGGGATGILAAAHLARRLDPANDEAVVIEPGEALGRGLAYATDDPRHLLNVRVANMSAFADEPHHLTAWLSARRGAGAASPFSFISRGLYGDYLADLAEQTLSNGLVRRVRARCSDIEEKADGVRLTLSTGEALAADVAILATGHDAKPTVGGIPAEQPWSAGALDGLPPDAPILIIGSGLTMVDLALSLERRGQHGPIVVLSRRGLLSTTHRPAPPRSLDASEIPFGSELSASLAWLRRLAARFAADGADWRSAVDALRPHTQRLWGAMSLEQRRRFLRHARSYWDVHRHRMAPQIEAALGALGASGQLTIVAGRVVAARRVDEGVEVESCDAALARRRRGASRGSSTAPACVSSRCRAPIRCCARCSRAARRGRTRSASASTSRPTSAWSAPMEQCPGGSRRSVRSLAPRSGNASPSPTSGCNARRSPTR